MARRLRIEFPGAVYHVLNRGNYRRNLFETPGAAESFLQALDEAVERYGWKLHAFVLMPNHFHLALETPEPNLGLGMHWLQVTMAVRFNRFRSEVGHLFQGRYKSILVEDDVALARLVDYIHLNPVRAGLVPPDRVAGFRWSSLFRFLRGLRTAAMTAEHWLLERGGWSDDPTGLESYREYLTELAGRHSDWESRGLTGLSQGWAIGTEGWKKDIARDQAARALEAGLEINKIRELREANWNVSLERALGEAGRSEADLETRPMRQAWKLAVAQDLRHNCGAPISWLAKHLKLGKPSSLRSYLSRIEARENQQTTS